MDKPLILIGGGGHARVLMDALLGQNSRLLGFIDLVKPPRGHPEVPWLGDDSVLDEYPPDTVLLVNGMGSLRDTEPRSEFFLRYRGMGYRFAQVLDSRAVISRQELTLGQGVQILAAAVINTGSRLGDDVLINTGAIVEHDCEVGAHCQIDSGAVLCAGCRLDTGVHIGAGATVTAGVSIGAEAIIEAGCVVTRNIEPLSKVVGTPGKETHRYS